MIIPKDATPPARGEPDAFHTPKTLDTVLESPGSAFRRVPQSPLTTPLAQIRGRPPRPFASARMPPPPRRLSPEPPGPPVRTRTQGLEASVLQDAS